MDVTKPSRIEEICLKLRSELRPLPYSSVDLRSYTLNFSDKIGFGGYGEVYKGHLPDGVPVAIKVLKNNDVMEDTFLAEVRILGKAFHLNLVKLYGYCFEDSMKALVFEYMENGSLDKILHENHHPSIEWLTLYGIAIEIARGLKYMHDEMDDQIIHYDIKASNVLLDKKFFAKITDFGLAKSINRDLSRATLTNTRGTFGYMAPETFLANSKVTSKSDVYSFGMMSFEILGKRNNGREKNWFPKIVWNQFKSGKLQHLIKDCGIKEKDKENAIRLSKVALWCVQFRPEIRPSMEDVVLMLEDKKLIEDPPYPLFLLLRDSTSQVVSEQCRANNERERLDSLECGDPIYPQNIIADKTNAPVADNGPGGYGGDSLPRDEDLAIFVPNKCKKIRTTKLVGKTALKYSEMILKWISKDEAITFCINGMGGVGKTTILDDVYNQLIAEDVERNQKYFDKIIWVSVSKDDNFIKLLQKDLAEELEIKLPSDDVLKRSRVLCQALKRKKVVLFLDDVWKEFSLDEIGIPQPTLENGCKLLLTTRKLDVSRRMGCHKDNTITVEPLPEDEAWDLFMKKVNYVLTPEVRKVAEMVAKKCSGLPLAIITVAKAMSDKNYSDIDYWTGALIELNLKDPSNETMDMEMENVYKCLKFSYDRLGTDKQRECLLCCALYPESCKIVKRNLLEFWIMGGILVGINRQDELFKGRCILDKLKDHCLLETVKVFDVVYGEISDGVKMHDLIRDMALRLKNKCFMVRDGPSLRELPKEEEWVNVEKASFMCNQIGTVSISPICPNLSTLILEGTFLESVSHDFFVHMKCLMVLDLRCDRMSKNKYLKLLPDSISDLVNLRVLRLSWYKRLKKLPSLAKLVLLRTLEFDNTDIKELPEGMERLVQLRYLNLHGVQLKEIIPFGLISKLSELQELYLSGIEVDKLYEVGKGESFAEELLSLKKLENLSVSFHCLSDYASYVGSTRFKGLTCFYLSIGGRMSNRGGTHLGPPPHATVKIICSPTDNHTAPFFPPNTKRVEAESFHDVIRLNELGWLIKDAKELVEFSVWCCFKMECMWSSKQNEELCVTAGTSSICWFQSLEKIRLFICNKLYTLFEGIPISLGVFFLKELSIHNCNHLKNVFMSSRLLQLFPKLEQITVGDCGEIEELIGDDDDENLNTTETPTIGFHSLKYLWIWFLPKLKRIHRGVIICNSLEVISVEKCLELKTFPQLKGEDHSTPPSALRKIKGSKEWWDSLEWDPNYPQNILQPFFKEDDDPYLDPDPVLSEGLVKGFTLNEVGVIRARMNEVGCCHFCSLMEQISSLMEKISSFTLNEVGVIRASMSEVVCCHFSSDGKLIASGGHDKKAVLWYTDSLKPKTTLEEHSMLITDIRFSPSLPRLATSSFDKTVRVWDVDNPDYSLRTFRGHSASVMSLDFHPNKEDLICSCDSDSEIRYWSIKNGSCVSVFKGGATQIRFQPRLGRYLATADENVVSIFDVETQSCRYSLQGHTEAIRSVCWNPSGELVASVTENSVRIWTLGSGNEGVCVQELSRNYGNEFHSCVFHPTYPSLLLIGSYQDLAVWDIAQNKLWYKAAHDGLIASLAVSNVTGLVASACHDKSIKLWKWF